MTQKLKEIQQSPDFRNKIISKAIAAGFNEKIVPFFLDFIIEELAEQPETVQTNYLKGNGITLDLNLHQCFYKKQQIQLNPIEFRILEYFMRRPNRILPHQEILCKIWSSLQQDNREYLRVHISQIRKKFFSDIIKNRRHEGYYFPLNA